ncbi:hypothetical protein V5799_003461 [Amblyomma americanum]|uniref:Uncharacterized protein n=1 Tax=Amblyomma americanum TaxID=6943 RepID=A0AAQ4D8X0_AMBAM
MGASPTPSGCRGVAKCFVCRHAVTSSGRVQQGTDSDNDPVVIYRRQAPRLRWPRRGRDKPHPAEVSPEPRLWAMSTGL